MPLSCFPEAEFTIFAFRSGEVKKLLVELDPYDGSGPDGIFLLFFIKTANYLAPKISTVLCKLVSIGGFSMCWRVGNITLVSKSGSANSCPLTIVLLPPPLFCLKYLSACWLSVLIILLRGKTCSHIYSLVSVKVLVLVMPF